MATEARDSAIREAKLYVREIVRNDWTFKPSTDAGAPASATPTPPEQEITAWRLRTYDSSASELEPLSSPTITSPPSGYDSAQIESQVLSQAGDERTERRRKRRRQMEEEMQWNEGLRTWVERRDAWTCAKSREEIVARRQLKQAQALAEATTITEETRDQGESSGSAFSRPASSSSRDEADLATRTEASLSVAEKEELGPSSVSAPPLHGEDQKESTETGVTEPEIALQQTVADDATDAVANAATPAPAPATAAATATASKKAHQGSEDPYVPVVPSLISASNPIRASITPAMYPSIYSKVVVQGLTPTVPINLADVTKAMVQGWKADGQWPPKPATTNLVLQDTATVPKTAEDGQPSSPESKRRSGVVGAVRKVLHFSGFHPHPFHRRSSHSAQGEVSGAVNTENAGK
ncbi:hypothetical protein BDV32DRAFT_21666 [Aspergillus pseudonomiae]|uniref:Gag1-like clamp domain-containing protein n=1 Tax=Aspergillus pseudonomiae TaxID=1506151 RepID=A0A5N6HMZ3_9EURO|nr:uncharacterized protein BDV37DRAFT_108327 [Aspergillus pseudonomiae]KAB8254093.1 hypothetical protein BDV32DRAFT_21666 [Aspergillus pseudonomiae]KAE8404641.1 hypothetical protein BDV37DRAFT_108327 [Aspergillus pseudonomiae]